jgi:hypothetical protein
MTLKEKQMHSCTSPLHTLIGKETVSLKSECPQYILMMICSAASSDPYDDDEEDETPHDVNTIYIVTKPNILIHVTARAGLRPSRAMQKYYTCRYRQG